MVTKTRCLHVELTEILRGQTGHSEEAADEFLQSFLFPFFKWELKTVKDTSADSQRLALTGCLTCHFKSTYRSSAKKPHASERIILHCCVWFGTTRLKLDVMQSEAAAAEQLLLIWFTFSFACCECVCCKCLGATTGGVISATRWVLVGETGEPGRCWVSEPLRASNGSGNFVLWLLQDCCVFICWGHASCVTLVLLDFTEMLSVVLGMKKFFMASRMKLEILCFIFQTSALNSKLYGLWFCSLILLCFFFFFEDIGTRILFLVTS